MRILHCITNAAGGGAERQLVYLVDGQTRAGLEVHVALLEGGPNLAGLLAARAHVHHLWFLRYSDPCILLHLLWLLGKLKPDLVQTWLPEMDVWAGSAALLRRVPWIVAERNCAAAYRRGCWQNWGRVWLGRRADLVVANSEGGGRYWRGLTKARIEVIPNIVAPVTDPPISRQPGLLLYVGRYAEQKNLHNMLVALDLVLGRFPETQVRLFGHGPLRHQLVQRGEVWPGRLLIGDYTTDIESWYGRAALLILVSSFEGMPNVLLEAASRGCPLVISDIAAHRDLFDSSTACLVDPADPASIAAGIAEVLTQPRQAEARARLARERIAAMSAAAAVVEHYQTLYRDLLGRQGSRNG